ncbi:hypothetical protein Sango_2438000 [Sesamum angolense]|uniref:Reverse transcriptase RNase H-like domain-containing protein n=1 Tax=Sesamum angolense TaxID=2727404 RepID=A0AAE1W7U7_9LAMI|nr:hypothetical protein Sango_2438000 [Sesamum angolense]
MKAQTNVNEVQELTGKIPALSRFISKAAEKKSTFLQGTEKSKKVRVGYLQPTSIRRTQKVFSKTPSTGETDPGGYPLLVFLNYPQAVSSVLICEEGGQQMPIYYISKVLNGAEERYTPIEKMTLALLDTSGQLVKWEIELSEYDISYLPCTTIKAQALANFVSKIMGTPMEDASKVEKWLLHVDGSSTTQGSGESVVITSSHGEDL